MKKFMTAIMLMGLLLILWTNILEMPAVGSIENPSYNHVSLHYIENAEKETFSPNVVTSIITDYRLFDTLGEMTVLFTAIAAVLTVLKSSHGKHKDHDGHGKVEE